MLFLSFVLFFLPIFNQMEINRLTMPRFSLPSYSTTGTKIKSAPQEVRTLIFDRQDVSNKEITKVKSQIIKKAKVIEVAHQTQTSLDKKWFSPDPSSLTAEERQIVASFGNELPKGVEYQGGVCDYDRVNGLNVSVDVANIMREREGAELYGTITEEAVHAGQKARGEVYDSEDGIGGRSEGLAEFANKTASSAWDLENKITGISNESNSLQMDNWRTDNSSSETMLIGLGKAENAQDVQPEVIVSEGTRFSQPGDVGHDPIIHKLNVYDYDKIEDYLADKEEQKKLESMGYDVDVLKEINNNDDFDFELTFEARSSKSPNKGTILGETEKWAEIGDEGFTPKYRFSIKDIGSELPEYTMPDGTIRSYIKFHPDVSTSTGCATFVDLFYNQDNIEIGNNRIIEFIPSSIDQEENTYILIPAIEKESKIKE